MNESTPWGEIRQSPKELDPAWDGEAVGKQAESFATEEISKLMCPKEFCGVLHEGLVVMAKKGFFFSVYEKQGKAWQVRETVGQRVSNLLGLVNSALGDINYDTASLKEAINEECELPENENIFTRAKPTDPEFLILKLLERHHQRAQEQTAKEALALELSSTGETQNPDLFLQESFGKAGYHLWNLDHRHCILEGALMDHCVGTYGEQTRIDPRTGVPQTFIFSFGLPRLEGFQVLGNDGYAQGIGGHTVYRQPVITIEYQPHTGRLGQIKLAKNARFPSRFENPELYGSFFQMLKALQEKLNQDSDAIGRPKIHKGLRSFGAELQHLADDDRVITIDGNTKSSREVLALPESERIIVAGKVKIPADVSDEDLQAYCRLRNVRLNISDLPNNKVRQITQVAGNLEAQSTQNLDLSSLTEIGGDADFGRAENVNLSSLKKIGGDADFGRAENVNLSSLKKIGGYAYFRWAKNIELSSLTEIGGDAYFAGAENIELSSLTEIGGNVYFEEVENLDLSSLTEIGGSAYFGGAKNIELSSLTEIGGNVYFRGAENIELSSLTEIGGYAYFRGSENLDLSSLTEIGGNADFGGAKNIELSSLKKIGGNAYFRGAENIELSSLTEIGGYADFGGAKNIDLSSLTEIGGDAYFEEAKNIELSSLKKIGGNAYFAGAENVNLSSLTEVGGNADFARAKNIKRHPALGGDIRTFDAKKLKIFLDKMKLKLAKILMNLRSDSD